VTPLGVVFLFMLVNWWVEKKSTFFIQRLQTFFFIFVTFFYVFFTFLFFSGTFIISMDSTAIRPSFDSHSTGVRLSYDRSTTYITTGLLHCG